MRVRPLSRSSSALLACVGVLLLGSCGTSPTAEVSSNTPTAHSTTSSIVMAPTGPTVTVPGLGGTADAASSPPTDGSSAGSSSSAPTSVPQTTTTVTRPPSSTQAPPTSSSPSSQAEPDPTTSERSTTSHEPTTSQAPEPPASTPTSDKPPTSSHRSTPASTPQPGGGQQNGGTMTRKIVVIDPGHNGQNGAHPEIITQQVDAGFGEMKNCNTTGTETNAGYTESLFNWHVALQLKQKLEAKGITVIMTRDSNDGVGPCVNERAAIGNDNKADVVVSIHGDGEDASVAGFYVMTAERPPAGEQMAAESLRLASDVRDGLVAGGLSPSNALGADGLWQRADLAGLNLSQRPTVMVELGNMRNEAEAALMSSDAGQEQYADGLAIGVVQYLIGH